jgi:hypothetical protein
MAVHSQFLGTEVLKLFRFQRSPWFHPQSIEA